MRAAVVTELNGPDGVVVREVPDPALKPGHVFIEWSTRGSAFRTSFRPGASTRCVQSCRLHPAGRYPVLCAKIRVVSVLQIA